MIDTLPNPTYVLLGLINVAVLLILFVLYRRTFSLHRRRLLTEFLTTVSMDDIYSMIVSPSDVFHYRLCVHSCGFGAWCSHTHGATTGRRSERRKMPGTVNDNYRSMSFSDTVC